jgi:hypothetical protein
MMSLDDVCALCQTFCITLRDVLRVCLKVLVILVLIMGFSYILIFPPYICFSSDDEIIFCIILLTVWAGILMSSIVPALIVCYDKIRDGSIMSDHYDFLNRFADASIFTIQLYLIIIVNVMICILTILLAFPFYHVITEGCTDVICTMAIAEALMILMGGFVLLFLWNEPIQEPVTV